MNTASPSRIRSGLTWLAQATAAVILLQTLFFKFTGARESVYIFSTLGMEPAGRLGSGLVELVAAVLLLIPGLAWAGAAVGLAVMSGALFFHLTSLGIVVLDDGGTLFALACVVFACCATVLWLRRGSIPRPGRRATALAIVLLASTASAETPVSQLNLENGLALQGYDPVSYFQGVAAEGDPAVQAEHQGATYHFATAANRKAFLADPAKYEPAYGGWCAWAMAQKGEKVEINPKAFKIVEGRLFVFYKTLLFDTHKDWDKLANEVGETTLVQKADAAWARIETGR